MRKCDVLEQNRNKCWISFSKSDAVYLESSKHARKKCCVCLQLRQSAEGTEVSDGSDREEVESIGKTLFNVVHQLDPTHCADITGMLKQILSERSMLEVAVQRAKSALEGLLSPTHSEMSE